MKTFTETVNINGQLLPVIFPSGSVQTAYEKDGIVWIETNYGFQIGNDVFSKFECTSTIEELLAKMSV